MSDDPVVDTSAESANADAPKHITASIFTAFPHYLPLGIFPLLWLALVHGDWWLIAPFIFMGIVNPMDRAIGKDGRFMDLNEVTERKLLWHNLPVWAWGCLWPPTLIFGLWQILVGNAYPIWQDVIVAILLTMEAQTVFVVGHELIHRRTTWERRLGEFLLASSSYPQYATEHLYIHHAQVGTPEDVGSAPKGVSFWSYFPREVASNLINSWKVIRQKLARQRRSVWHYSNPFWRYIIALAFWYGLIFWMSGIVAVLVFIFLGMCCVFSMKLSNYFQHYGLRRVRLPNGRWEKALPRHSWSADWKLTNWMFFNMQRHADHHSMANRQYPLLQIRGTDESPELPGTYGDMMSLVLRPKRWFEKIDPLVDQWREHFYPEIDDWTPYDSPLSASRPESFDAIIEIFGAAPRLAKRIERNPELLDNLRDREFTDLDIPKGFGPDAASESIARRGLTRLYWTHEMSVVEMKEIIAELPAIDANDTAQALRDWTNDKAFQVGMHVLRENLTPSEANIALSNLAEASVATLIERVTSEFIERYGSLPVDGIAAVFLGDLASKEAYPGIEIDLVFVHDGFRPDQMDRLFHRCCDCISNLAHDSLLFSPVEGNSDSLVSLSLRDMAGHFAPQGSEVPALTKARCIFEHGDTEVNRRFQETRANLLLTWNSDESLKESLRHPPEQAVERGIVSFVEMSGGFNDTERAARIVQLSNGSSEKRNAAPSAVSLFQNLGNSPLEQAATLWQDLHSIQRLVGDEGFDVSTARPRVKTLIAHACGYEDFDQLNNGIVDTAANSAAEIDTLVSSS